MKHFLSNRNKLDQKGFDHVFLAVIIVVFVAILGTFYVVYSRAATSNYPIVHSSGQCLNNKKDIAASGNPVEVYHCLTETAPTIGAQQWTVKNDTIVNKNGFCLAAQGRKAGKYVVLQRCDGSSLQKWTVNKSAKTIVSKPSGFCLGVENGSTEDNTLTQVKVCNGAALQQWTIQDTATAPTISSFTASPASVTTGSTSKLSWTVADTKSCSVTPGGPTDTTATSWTTPTQTTAGTKTFTLTCKNSDGATITRTANLTVTSTTTTTPPTSSTSGCNLNGVAAPCIGGLTTAASGWGGTVFADEFNGTSLDANKWAKCFFPGSYNGSDTCGEMNDSVTLKSNVRMENGNVVLRQSTTSADSPKDAGALINTDPTQVGSGKGFQMGAGHYAEARVYFPGNGTYCYNWPAWWINGGKSGFGDGEIDVAEVGGSGVMGSNYHIDRGNGREITQNKIPGYWCGGYHIYGVDRQNGKNVIYFDGKQVASYATYDNGAPQYLIFNVGYKAGKTPASGAASDVKVDYVRVWKK